MCPLPLGSKRNHTLPVQARRYQPHETKRCSFALVLPPSKNSPAVLCRQDQPRSKARHIVPRKRTRAAHPLFQAAARMPQLLGAARLVTACPCGSQPAFPNVPSSSWPARAFILQMPVAFASGHHPPIEDRFITQNNGVAGNADFQAATLGYLGNGNLVPPQVAESAQPALDG